MWFHRVFCNVWAYVSCREYVGTLKSARFAVNQGGTTDKLFIRPWQSSVLSRAFCFRRYNYVYKTMANFRIITVFLN